LEEKSYQVVDGLGMGGFATVLEVLEEKSKKSYAMKVVSKSKLKHQEHRDQILLELKIMESVVSPFLVRCYDTFETDRNLFFIIDFVGGGDLFHHLNEKNGPPTAGGGGGASEEAGGVVMNNVVGFGEVEARFMLAELYLAIEHLHSKGYLHRDIKVENVMLDYNGHVKLIDFGFAAEVSHESNVQPLLPGGSLVCLSPELITERTGGRHTDWWAYGVVAYELLTGLSPWSSITDRERLRDEIQHLDIQYPQYLSREAQQMLMLLLCRRFEDRLGFERDDEIKSIAFFKNDINWKRLASLQCPPPFVPGYTHLNKADRDAAVEAYERLMQTER
jgi:ribosomal protein S6 kinase beta